MTRPWYYETKPIHEKWWLRGDSWRKVMDQPTGIDTAIRNLKEGQTVYGHLYYTRIRNRITGEIIPGDIFG